MKPKQWLFYLSGIPAYYLIYLGLEGMSLLPSVYMLSNYSTYTYYGHSISIPLYNFVPERGMSPFFIVVGGIMVFGLYLHYYYQHRSKYK